MPTLSLTYPLLALLSTCGCLPPAHTLRAIFNSRNVIISSSMAKSVRNVMQKSRPNCSESVEMLVAEALRPRPRAYTKLSIVSTRNVNNSTPNPTAPAEITKFRRHVAHMRPRFQLDCCSLPKEKLPEYDGTQDRCLDDFFRRRIYRRQLMRLRKLVADLAVSRSRPRLRICGLCCSLDVCSTVKAIVAEGRRGRIIGRDSSAKLHIADIRKAHTCGREQPQAASGRKGLTDTEGK